MLTLVALSLCIGFILCLFWIDSRRTSNTTHALWLPVLWLLVTASRPVSAWLGLTVPIESPDVYLEGSPVDRAFFIAMMLSGIVVLFFRKIHWLSLAGKNMIILLFLLYCGISAIWSDYPFVTLKRWIKALAELIMVLIVVTEPDPIEAVKTVIRRCAYVLIPLSVLFIKYIPDLGRAYTQWTWKPVYVGVTTNKNYLGAICLVFGYFLVSELIVIWQQSKEKLFRWENLFVFLVIIMISWLMFKADSATSLATLLLGLAAFWMLGWPFVRENNRYIRYFFLYTLTFAAFLVISEAIPYLVSVLGRDLTFTGRTDLWHELIDMHKSPVLGEGYEGFWLGERAAHFWDKYYWRPNQAHNGFLEIYLNLGLVGLLLLFVLLYNSLTNGERDLAGGSDYDFGRLRIAYLVIVLVYNWTEAAFKTIHIIWFAFLLLAIEYFRPRDYPPGSEEDPAGGASIDPDLGGKRGRMTG